MKLEKKTIGILETLITQLGDGFSLPEISSIEEFDYEKMTEVLSKTAEKLHDNYPYFHPLYAGQMLKPPHPIARAAYMLAMWINPNNHALDGGRASSAMEKEVVADIARMFGWEQHLGHLTSGGTMANLEALWVAGNLHPGKLIVGSELAHYTHQRISEVLKLDFEKVATDKKGKMDLTDLERLCREKEVGTVVVTMGTTGIGSVDPLPEILELQQQYGFRIHADSAYGGYFRLVDSLPDAARKAYAMLDKVDSIVIDPHKHGLQPYGCGCILFRDPAVSKFYLHDSPYTYYSSDEIHLGEISLECSRAGAAAVALWATHQLLPPVPGGEFAASLSKCRQAALRFVDKIEQDDRFSLLLPPELDIVAWMPRGASTQEISDISNRFFKEAESHHLYLALLNYPTKNLPDNFEFEINSEHVTCLRACMMKPEHLEWVERLWEKIEETAKQMGL